MTVSGQPTRRDVLVLFGGAALVVACGSKSRTPATSVTTAATRPSPTTSTTAAQVLSTYPLTGLPATDPGRASRPSIVVKIDNAPAARPQAGLDGADLVFEEVVEGGVVRFAAVFHSTDVASIGPVRSVRAEDAVLATPLRGYFVYSGGNDIFNAIIRKAPVGLISEDTQPPILTRRRDRRGPSNLYTSTGAVYEKAAKRTEVPPAFFAYRRAGEPLGGGAVPTANLRLTLGERTTLEWSYDTASGRWLRTTNNTPHLLENGARLAFPNVVIQFCRYQDTTVRDASGTVSPEAVLVGDGEAWVLSGPALARGRWSRSDAATVTRFVDATGMPLLLQPGPTWIVLAPVGAPTQVR